ncbi:MAG TPA: ATP-dependent Clp protease adaptor ClpS [Saprospiraceae bacterium]|nr:ATP-dependent Clp protease adaptor ClpS [Saprospiraceae bacterium]
MSDLERLFSEDLQIDVEEVPTDNFDSSLIVYNDEYNTFDWVIECFITVCGHSIEQSEQLSYIIHYKGKATVKEGPFDKLQPMKEALIERGLSAVIETRVAK